MFISFYTPLCIWRKWYISSFRSLISTRRQDFRIFPYTLMNEIKEQKKIDVICPVIF